MNEILHSLSIPKDEFLQICQKKSIDISAGLLFSLKIFLAQALKRKDVSDIRMYCYNTAELYYRMPDALQALKYYMQGCYIDLAGYQSDLNVNNPFSNELVYTIYSEWSVFPPAYKKRIIKLLQSLGFSEGGAKAFYYSSISDMPIPLPEDSINETWQKMSKEIKNQLNEWR